MKKLSTFLMLLMLLMGTGQTWADRTWTFTNGFDKNQLKAAGFEQDGTSHRYTITNKQAGPLSNVTGTEDLMFSGTFTLYDSGGSLLVPAGNEFSVGIPAGAGKIVTVSGYFDTVTGATGTVTWEGGSGLQAGSTNYPSYGSSVTEKTPLALGGYANDYWVGFTIHNSNGRPFHITKIQVFDNAPSMSFSKDYDELNLIDLDYNEPTLNKQNIPDGAVISYRPSNWDLARVNPANNSAGYEVMATHKGYTGIIAECKLGDVVLCSAAYTLYIKADDYTYEVTNNGKTYTITGPGGIPNRIIDDVSFIEMQYGDAEGSTNLPIVRDLSEGLVSTVLDQNGWRHIWLSGGSDLDRNGNTVPANQPYQGTFYIFKPQIDGTLTINMAVRGTWAWNSNAVMVDATALTTAYATFAGSQNCTDYTVNIQGGHTYYLYALTPNVTIFSGLNNDDWSIAELHGFTFEPTGGYFEYKGLVLKNGKLYDVDGNERCSSTGQKLVGNPNNTEYTIIECLGDASATINSSTGILTIDATKGGAIAVGAKVNGENRDYYMITVPYTTHDWFFTESVQSPSKITHNDYTQTAWGFTYKIMQHDANNTYIMLKDAVLCNARDITGNNAGFLSQTAGLVFKSSPKRFGTNTSFDWTDYDNVIKNEEGLEGDDYKAALHNIITDYIYKRGIDQLTNDHATDYITMATNSSLIIPSLKKGQYIRIWWRRHSGNQAGTTTQGDLYRATNVTDLAGTPITNVFYAGNGNGYEEFIVANDGDVSFTLQVEGAVSWTDIFRVTVGEVGEFLETTLTPRMDVSAVGAADQVRNRINVENPAASLPHPVAFDTNYRTMYSLCNDGTDSKEVTLLRNNGTTGTKGFNVSFAIGGSYGTAPSLSGNKLTVSGTGIAGIVANVTSNGYIIDTDTTTIAYGVVEPRNYPYTWDFTNVGTLTQTLGNLGDAALEGTGAQASWYMKDGDPNKKTADQLKAYKQWQANGDEYQLNVYHEDIKCVDFAQGSQLVVNGQALPETQGLGIYLKKANNHYNDYATNDHGQDYLRIGNGYLQFHESGDRLSFIRVPAVPAGAKVYLCASGNATPSVYTQNGSGTYFVDHGLNVATAAEQAQLSSNDNGTTYVYENANGGDVLINVNDMKVYKLAVTSTFKTLTDYQGKSYATESREHNEKYDLSGYFTGKEISAFKVTGYAESEKGLKIEDTEYTNMPLAGKLNLEPVEVAPSNTGVILQGEGTSFSQLPLFVKDINTNEDVIGTNYMVPSSQGAPANPYILAMKYAKLDADGNPTGETGNGPLAFYKMYTGTLGANKAYFAMPETSSNVTKTGTYTFNPTTMNLTQTNQVKNQNFGDEHISIAFDDLVEIGNQNSYFVNGESGNGAHGQYLKVRTKDGISSIITISGNNAKVTGITINGIDNKRNITYNGIEVTSSGDKYDWTSSWTGEESSITATYTGGNYYATEITVTYTYTEASGSTSGANYDMFWFIDDDDEGTDAIERIALEEQFADVMAADAVFYNLNGQKLSGKPTQRGIYICNGKKVYVK